VLDADEINWFHSIDLGNGLVTEGHKSLEMLDAEFGRLGLTEENLAGKRVLDIGCNDGYMALRCKQLGADVTAVDGVYREGLKYVRRHLQPRFRPIRRDPLPRWRQASWPDHPAARYRGQPTPFVFAGEQL